MLPHFPWKKPASPDINRPQAAISEGYSRAALAGAKGHVCSLCCGSMHRIAAIGPFEPRLSTRLIVIEPERARLCCGLQLMFVRERRMPNPQRSLDGIFNSWPYFTQFLFGRYTISTSSIHQVSDSRSPQPTSIRSSQTTITQSAHQAPRTHRLFPSTRRNVARRAESFKSLTKKKSSPP